MGFLFFFSFHQGYNGNKEMLGKCEQVSSSFWFQHSASFCLLMETLNYTVVLPGANESSTCGGQAKSFCF